ncbi:NERD domain-containing protein [Virgibacillus necropolis]|uniref:NERD domain-containing protein n=1 Tax=Virgibacillus necropolis TaxID=163877 RepID=UPI00384C40CF
MIAIAQLIKLQDYVSRYEWNAYHYPSQYIRLKQENWQKLHHLWSNPQEETDELESDKTLSTFAKWKSFIKKDPVVEMNNEKADNFLPKAEEDLKHYFLDKLLPFQLKWASSTVTEVSFIDKSYEKDAKLKFFLQRFPDTYLLMYYPIFSIKKAPVDGELILISPIGIEIIYLIEERPNVKILAGDERTWGMETSDQQSKMLSPLIALKRTEQIVKRILATEQVDFPINKIVLSRTNKIVFHTEPYNTKIIGKLEFEQWFNEKRNLVSPLKNRQLKVIDTLLKHCQTTSMKRPEWEEEPTFTMDDKS